MSDDRDESTGQFVSTADPAEGLYGAEATDARAGLITRPDPAKADEAGEEVWSDDAIRAWRINVTAPRRTHSLSESLCT
jgi:hypothetical protein